MHTLPRGKLLWHVIYAFLLKAGTTTQKGFTQRKRGRFLYSQNKLNRDETLFLYSLSMPVPCCCVLFTVSTECSIARQQFSPPTYILIYAKCRLELVAQKSIYAAPLLDKPIWSFHPLWFGVCATLYQMKRAGKIQSSTISIGNLQNG